MYIPEVEFSTLKLLKFYLEHLVEILFGIKAKYGIFCICSWLKTFLNNCNEFPAQAEKIHYP